MKKIVFNSTILSFFVSVALGIFLIFCDSFAILTKIFLIFFSMFGFSVVALCSYIKSKKRKLLSSLGVMILLTGFIYSILLIFDILNSDFSFNIFYTIIIAASLFTIICLSNLIKSNDGKVKISKGITLLLFLLLMILLLSDVWFLAVSKRFIMITVLLIIISLLVTIIINGLYYEKKEPEVKEVSKYEKLDELKVLLDTLTISKADFDREKDRLLNNKKKN